ncbi:MAG TPA: MFS transporter, partial [Anaerolineales bacterium]|nr:MFS transporter [Anaerolineales bacterium]
HIAGIVNPPAANKYGFWINSAAKLPATADEFFAGAEQPLMIYALIGITGLGMSAHWVLPWAMLPDVVEAAPEGAREAGVYYGVYGLSDKIMRTIGITLPGYALQAAGYVPNVAQGAESLLAIAGLAAITLLTR